MKIKYYLDKDPKKHMYDLSNPNHTVNRANTFGLRPLYIACLHGHIEVAQLLVKEGADPYLTSITNTDYNKSETNLKVTCRWHHNILVKYLL